MAGAAAPDDPAAASWVAAGGVLGIGWAWAAACVSNRDVSAKGLAGSIYNTVMDALVQFLSDQSIIQSSLTKKSSHRPLSPLHVSVREPGGVVLLPEWL